jgi:hypothetical protein
MNNLFRYLPLVALFGATVNACGDDAGSESPSTMNSTSSTTSGSVPSSSMSSTGPGPTSTGSTPDDNAGGAGNDDTTDDDTATDDDTTSDDATSPDAAAPNDAECPGAEPEAGGTCDTSVDECTYGETTCTCEAPFGGGFGGFGGGETGEGTWDCEAADETETDPESSDAGAAPEECPAAEPDDGDECAVAEDDECTYGATTCTCPEAFGGGFGGFGGGGGGERSWDCSTDEAPEPAGDGGAEPTEEPGECPAEAPNDGDECDAPTDESCSYEEAECECAAAGGGGFGGGGGDLEWACEEVQGTEPSADAGEAATCPEEAPEEGGECDLPRDLECEYGPTTCDCGGAPNDRSWNCDGAGGPQEDASVPAPEDDAG